MFTRKINKDTATQLNTDKIGVLVHPNIYPPIVTVDDIVVDYKYDTVTSISMYNPGDGDRLMIEETDGGVYYWGAIAITVDGVDYYRWDKYDSSTGVWADQLWSTSNLQEVGDDLYTSQESGGVITSMVLVSAIKSVFNVSGTFIKIDEYNCYNSSSGTYSVDGNCLCDTVTGNKVGCISSNDQHIDENKTFVKGNTSGDYQMWTNDDYVASGYGTRNLYTPSDSPSVGDTALFTLSNEGEYNPQTIKSIDTTTTPVPPDPVECTVSYSIDGKTWTDVDTVLTDDNNVICNIPKYVYLKFSQDVEITEE